jgi:predicted DNA-binding transcriptional regulator YafY
LPQPNRSIVVRELDDGRVEAEITVIGRRHLDHTLLALSPDSEVVWPEDWRERRRALARALLERYAESAADS